MIKEIKLAYTIKDNNENVDTTIICIDSNDNITILVYNELSDLQKEIYTNFLNEIISIHILDFIDTELNENNDTVNVIYYENWLNTEIYSNLSENELVIVNKFTDFILNI